MQISDEMAGVLERNCGEIILSNESDGSICVNFVFHPDLKIDSEDGIILKNELMKMLKLCSADI